MALKTFAFCLALAWVPHGASAVGLTDNPIVGKSITYLDGKWSASMTSGTGATAETMTIPAKVPGDLISDLYAAGAIENPYYEDNWLNSSIWNEHNWTYTTTFDATAGSLLVFDGVKMGAHIQVNGKLLGQTTDQFLRYTFSLEDSVLLGTKNKLEVRFDSAILCDGRWMSCTGGWDWAPYSNTTQEGTNTFSKGIWKSVYVVNPGPVAIEHFQPLVSYKGAYPLEPLTDESHQGFDVNARVHFLTEAATTGTLTISGSWGSTESKKVTLPKGNSSVTLSASAGPGKVKLWWPAGAGAQTLYDVTATFTPDGSPAVSTQRRIGFRYAVLVTGNDTEPGYVQKAESQEGTDSHGMVLRVNGAAILMRGANMIPMEELEGWMDADAHTVLVRSAAQARFNTLRVWGGGMFLPDAWYDECDALGIMIYHDMQYAQQGHSPKVTATQDGELRHIIRRLSHHTSIVIWDGCNECQVYMGTPTAIYADFVMTVIAEEDDSRVVWPSCPAAGWKTGVHLLTQHPNGNKLTTPPAPSPSSAIEVGWGTKIETHGPYQHGAGFPSVNGNPGMLLFPSNIPLKLTKSSTGLGSPNVFASEFGAVAMSSFESMAPTLDPKHWALHAGQPADTCSGKDCKGSNVMAQRNYPCDNMIVVFFGQGGQEFNKTGEEIFKQQLYQCMIAQALNIKQNIETRRSQNQFGIIVWQFNEIWPTGGWGSIEYGNPTFPGQVIGGRWKPLQYWYKASIYTDVMATCGQGGLCYVKSDAPFGFSGTLFLNATSFATGMVTTLLKQSVTFPAGAGAIQWLQNEAVASLDGTTHILEAIIVDSTGVVTSNNVVPFVTPEKMMLKPADVSVSVSSEDGAFVAKVTTKEVALYVTLTTLAHGVFEDNAFLLRPPGRNIKFIPMEPSKHSLEETQRLFASSLRVEDVSKYRPASDVSVVI